MNVPAIRTRIPPPKGFSDPVQWRVLCEVIFPNARTPEAIQLAIDYCKVRKLDVMKKPVHIVSVWDSKKRGYVEGLWAGINEVEITAARTGEYGGVDGPVFGPAKTQIFKGRTKVDGDWKDTTVTVTYPEWCERTVYRITKGLRCPITERVFWLEEYGHAGGGELPNAMWAKRPYSQFGKVAKAVALRTAFPEEEGGNPTSDEMVGKDISDADDAVTIATAEAIGNVVADAGSPDHDEDGVVIEDAAPAEAAQPDKLGETLSKPPHILEPLAGEPWQPWGQRLIAHINAAATLDDIDAWIELNKDNLDDMRKGASGIHATVMRAVLAAQRKLHKPEGGQT